jgi:hypothetical protein
MPGWRHGAGTPAFHTKFGPGTVAAVDGNKCTVDFDKAGELFGGGAIRARQKQ